MEDRNVQIQEIVTAVLEDYSCGRDIDTVETGAHQETVKDLIEQLRRVIFPGCGREEEDLRRRFSTLIEDAAESLNTQIGQACRAAGQINRDTAAVTLEFFRLLPSIRATVQTDLEAAFQGDPAATGMAEVVCCYPGLFAITVYRLAHGLYMLNVPMLPRIMTEYAHSVTGIDIHPGAQIGGHFFIDHGTGIVIGQTARIGSHVKLYQGVTLGALSTRGGQSLRGARRHPTIEDRVTIYAGASVLGGDTVIGSDAVIGANAFVTRSVPPCATVTGRYPQEKEHPPA